MPDLQKSYIYKDWILDISLVGAEEWSRFNLYHQCEFGSICRAKGVLKNEDVLFRIECTRCHLEIPADVLQQMRAMWNLLSKP